MPCEDLHLTSWRKSKNCRVGNLQSEDLPWSSTTTCGHGRVMVSVKLSSWQHCLYLFETHSHKDMYSYCCQENLPIATSHFFHLKCQCFYQYAASQKLYELCQFNILFWRQMAFYTSINLINLWTWIFRYGLAAAQLWAGMRIRGRNLCNNSPQIYLAVEFACNWDLLVSYFELPVCHSLHNWLRSLTYTVCLYVSCLFLKDLNCMCCPVNSCYLLDIYMHTFGYTLSWVNS